MSVLLSCGSIRRPITLYSGIILVVLASMRLRSPGSSTSGADPGPSSTNTLSTLDRSLSESMQAAYIARFAPLEWPPMYQSLFSFLLFFPISDAGILPLLVPGFSFMAALAYSAASF